ncbi:hypothetical protein FRC10_007172, partial [Ceratobasidium sp. 414]
GVVRTMSQGLRVAAVTEAVDEILDHIPSPVTRSRQALGSAAVVQDPVMAAYAGDKYPDPLAADYYL